MELRTPRLLLRHARPSDVSAMHEILSHPQAMRYWSTLPHESLAVTERWFEHMLDTEAAGNQFAVELDGRLVGRVGMWRPPEIGFIFHPDVWGRGIATEALTAFVDHAFSRAEINALTADVDPRNLASLKLLQRLGFTVTGTAERTFLLGDEWCDSVYLTLPRPEMR